MPLYFFTLLPLIVKYSPVAQIGLCYSQQFLLITVQTSPSPCNIIFWGTLVGQHHGHGIGEYNLGLQPHTPRGKIIVRLATRL